MTRCFFPSILLAGFVFLGVRLPAQDAKQQAASPGEHNPRIEIANVLFRYAPDLSILVVGLRGSLVPTQGHSVPDMNDPASFVIAADAAQIEMTTSQIAGLMNSWLLSSPKAQLKDVRISIAGDQLLIQGTMRKAIHVPFQAKAVVGLTGDNRIRFAVSEVRAAGVPMKGLMDALGLTMQSLVSQKGLNGMTIDKDSFLIDPQTAFPPPQLRAKITNAKVSGQRLVIAFGQGLPKLVAPVAARNYLALRGGSVRYGREEMADSDLVMSDSTPADPFEFYLRRYWCQMVAGTIHVTASQALRVTVPDFAKLPQGSCGP